MTKLTTIAVDQLQSMQGTKLGISPWVQLSQLMVNQFAEITNDHQFIHTDPERAGATSDFNELEVGTRLVVYILQLQRSQSPSS